MLSVRYGLVCCCTRPQTHLVGLGLGWSSFTARELLLHPVLLQRDTQRATGYCEILNESECRVNERSYGPAARVLALWVAPVVRL